jgi:hypothetical protein
VLHNLALDLLIGEPAALHGVLTGDVHPDVLVHAQLPQEEGLADIEAALGAVGGVGQVAVGPLLSPGEDHHAVLLVLPVYQPQLLELAAIVADGDDVGLEPLGEEFVGGASGVGEDGFEEEEDLLVVAPVEVEGQLPHALSAPPSLILFVSGEASRPQLVIFFKQALHAPQERLGVHGSGEEGVRLDEPEQLGTVGTAPLLVLMHPLVDDDSHIQITK